MGSVKQIQAGSLFSLRSSQAHSPSAARRSAYMGHWRCKSAFIRRANRRGSGAVLRAAAACAAVWFVSTALVHRTGRRLSAAGVGHTDGLRHLDRCLIFMPFEMADLSSVSIVDTWWRCIMLKSCQYCGRIHDTHYDCGRRPKSDRKPDAADRFRWTKQWQRKREQIRERDRSLCRWCLEKGRLSCEGLSVHHIEPLSEAWDMRLEDDNLITLCSGCHEEAEQGRIPRSKLHELTGQEPCLASPLPRTGKNSEPLDNDAGPRKTKDSRNEN